MLEAKLFQQICNTLSRVLPATCTRTHPELGVWAIFLGQGVDNFGLSSQRQVLHLRLPIVGGSQSLNDVMLNVCMDNMRLYVDE